MKKFFIFDYQETLCEGSVIVKLIYGPARAVQKTTD